MVLACRGLHREMYRVNYMRVVCTVSIASTNKCVLNLERGGTGGLTYLSVRKRVWFLAAATDTQFTPFRASTNLGVCQVREGVW